MKAIIVDDELLPGRFLEEMLNKYCFEITDVETFVSPVEALKHISTNTVDILFLDVEMPEMSSFDFLKKAMLPAQTQIILVTAYSKYAIEAFKAEVTHYLLKPVDKEELILAVRRAFKNLKEKKALQGTSSDKLSIYDGEKYIIVNKKDIIRLEADGSYTKFFLEKESFVLASRRLGHYEQQLEKKMFFRCHKSHVINVQKIYSVDRGKAGCIVLKNGEEVPISSSQREQLRILLDL